MGGRRQGQIKDLNTDIQDSDNGINLKIKCHCPRQWQLNQIQIRSS